MEYQLNITGFEKNPFYKEPELFQHIGHYDKRKPEERDENLSSKYLTVRITAAQFEAIRKSMLEVF